MTGQLKRRDNRLVSSIRDEFEQRLSEWFEQPFGTSTAAGGWAPRYDLEETDDAWVMHVELPGIEPDEIEVSLDDQTLTITGERRFYDKKEEDGFTRVERSFGSFHRAVRLPSTVEADAIEATHDNGVLTVTIPRSAQAPAHRIEVKRG
jgi:HSP20 family protein